MADLTITAANVKALSTATKKQVTAGVAVTAGQVVALDSTTGTYKLCDVNSGTADLRKPKGIALHAAAADQPLTILTRGKITIGATVAVGVTYYASGTGGGIRQAADNTTGDYVAEVGIGVSTTQIDVLFHEAGAPMA
jgi:hypothetical protein